jgi:Ca-activated chloride channel family protein
MLANMRRAGLGLCILILAACAAQSTHTEQGERDEGRVSDQIAPPPPPPPPPPVAANEALAGVVTGSRVRRDGFAAPYAQTAPQPMPGDIDRENYDDTDPNPIHLGSEDPVSTFSIDVDTASYSNVRRLLNQGRLPPRSPTR